MKSVHVDPDVPDPPKRVNMTIAVHSLIKNSTESPVSFSLPSLPPFYCTGAFRGALLNGRGIRFGEWGGMWPWTCCRSGLWDRHTPSSRRLSLSSRKSHSSPGRNSYYCSTVGTVQCVAAAELHVGIPTGNTGPSIRNREESSASV